MPIAYKTQPAPVLEISVRDTHEAYVATLVVKAPTDAQSPDPAAWGGVVVDMSNADRNPARAAFLSWRDVERLRDLLTRVLDENWKGP
jgi:hypothetical protein